MLSTTSTVIERTPEYPAFRAHRPPDSVSVRLALESRSRCGPPADAEGLSDRKRKPEDGTERCATDLRDRLGDLAINAPLQEALMPARPSASNSCVDIRSVVHHAQQRIASTAQSDLVNSKVCLVFHHAAGRPPFEPALA
jgi:hypothetical protein